MADHSHTFFVMVVVFHWLFLLRFPLALNFHQSVTNLHTINQQQQADEATRIKQATSLIGKIFPIFFFQFRAVWTNGDSVRYVSQQRSSIDSSMSKRAEISCSRAHHCGCLVDPLVLHLIAQEMRFEMQQSADGRLFFWWKHKNVYLCSVCVSCILQSRFQRLFNDVISTDEFEWLVTWIKCSTFPYSISSKSSIIHL